MDRSLQTKSACLLHGDQQFLIQHGVRRVRGQIQAVKACVSPARKWGRGQTTRSRVKQVNLCRNAGSASVLLCIKNFIEKDRYSDPFSCYVRNSECIKSALFRKVFISLLLACTAACISIDSVLKVSMLMMLHCSFITMGMNL